MRLKLFVFLSNLIFSEIWVHSQYEYTAFATNMFLEGLFTEKGVFPPELIGKH